jgi:hypothetical protein
MAISRIGNEAAAKMIILTASAVDQIYLPCIVNKMILLARYARVISAHRTAAFLGGEELVKCKHAIVLIDHGAHPARVSLSWCTGAQIAPRPAIEYVKAKQHVF